MFGKNLLIASRYMFYDYSQVQIDPLYQPAQLLNSLVKVGAKALICPGDTFYLRLRALVPELDSYPESGVEIKSDKIPSLKSLIITSEKQYR
jgi:hypothetical protein